MTMNLHQLRRSFLESLPDDIRAQLRFVNGKRRPVIAPQNSQPADVRMAWVDYVDAMRRGGHISDATANSATL